MTVLAGIDIGGTKCAVCLGETAGDGVQVIAKRRFLTLPTPAATLAEIGETLATLLAEHPTSRPTAVGISCGGPLDSRAGLILSPPNLPGWDRFDVVAPLRARLGVRVVLQNDANACALAEWRWGAGRGCRNMVFLTFGTGMGAGLILDGRLYSGANDMAGEVGHVRLEHAGPVGYGKAGSFEGFCSGGGIAQLGRSLAAERLAAGQPPAFCHSVADLPDVSAEKIGLATLAEEALPISLAVCQIVPAGLGEAVGDLASLSVALVDS